MAMSSGQARGARRLPAMCPVSEVHGRTMIIHRHWPDPKDPGHLIDLDTPDDGGGPFRDQDVMATRRGDASGAVPAWFSIDKRLVHGVDLRPSTMAYTIARRKKK